MANDLLKILDIGSSQFFTGISFGGAHDDSALFYKATGISPFVYTAPTQQSFGLLQTTSAPVNLTGVVDMPLSMVSIATGANAGSLFANGSDGHFYKIDLSGDNYPTDLRAATNSAIVDSAVGINIYKGNCIYSQKTNVGTWDMAGTYATGWDDDAYTGLTSGLNHQLYEFANRIYIPNVSTIARLPDATSGAIEANVLDFPSDFRVQCLSDDGQYLIIGISKNQGDNAIFGCTKVCFWDTYSDSWNKEWVIPDPNVITITKDSEWLYALCGRGIYRFNYDYAPRLVFPYQSAESPRYGCPQTSDLWKGMPIWGAYTEILSYGSFLPNLSKAFFKLWSGLTGEPTAILANAKNDRLFVGTAGDKLYRFTLTTGGATSRNAQTVYFDLKQKYQILKIRITFGIALASGDSLNVDVSSDPNATATDWGTYSFANDGAVQEVSKTNLFSAKLLSLTLNFNGGTPTIRWIEVFGKPDTNYA